MSTTRSQRLVNLVAGLLASRTHLTADEIRHRVEGYGECETDSAFNRMFERDKKELRDVGVPIDQSVSENGTVVGYRIVPEAYGLPELTLTPEQVGILAVAAEMLRGSERSSQVGGAMSKLSAVGLDAARGPEPSRAAEVSQPRELGTASVFAEAKAEGKRVSFTHTSPGREPTRRTVEPWWVGSRDGHWYLVGYDLDREDSRVFRVVRACDARILAQPITQSVPSTAAVLTLLDDALAAIDPRVTAEVKVAAGRAADLRSRAESVRQATDGSGDSTDGSDSSDGSDDTDGSDILTLTGNLSSLAAAVAMHVPDARPLGPPELLARVREILQAAAGRSTDS